mgnify:CR=1 FL=1
MLQPPLESARSLRSRGGDPSDLKTKFDALGTAIRAGVAPQSAAQVVGLDGIKFTGAVPVALRLPETQSADLEEK